MNRKKKVVPRKKKKKLITAYLDVRAREKINAKNTIEKVERTELKVLNGAFGVCETS